MAHEAPQPTHTARPVEVLYFARLSELVGKRQESVALPETIHTLGELRSHLSQRGNAWNALSADNVRMAVNQEIADGDTPVRPGDEVAFFPPVTGG